jgi:hypothetical protein
VIAVLAALALLSTIGIQAARATAGAQRWVARYDGLASTFDSAAASAVSPDGSRLFVTGSLDRFRGDNYRTAAFDAGTGAVLWKKGYNGPGDGRDVATAIGVSPDGTSVFVTGWSMGSTTWVDYATIAYDAATGTRLWLERYTYPLDDRSADQPTALGVSPDGSTVFVTGTSWYDYATVAYDAATGSTRWVARYDAGSWEKANVLAVSPDGSRVFVSGSSVTSATSLDIATVAYDVSSGDRLWTSRYDGRRSREDQANAIGVSPDGSRVFVAGFSEGSNRQRDFVTVAYTGSHGAQRWVRRYNGPGDWNDNVKALVVNPDGSRVFVAGYRTGGKDYRDFETIAYDASSGDRVWLRSHEGTGNWYDQATAIGVSPDGLTVFVTGFDTGSATGRDYATLAYRASGGSLRWVAHYDESVEVPVALTVRPDGGTVFVTGSAGGDYVTVAYEAS